MTNEITLTYQARFVLSPSQELIFEHYASLLSTVERSLYAEAAKGKSPASCKNEYLRLFEITARQFNACRVSLEGKIAACRALQEHALTSLKIQIDTLEKKVKLLEMKPSKQFTLHQKKRRLSTLKCRFD